MPRQPLSLGTYGALNTKKQPNGSVRAWTRYRDFDGVTRIVQRYDTTAAKAKDKLRRALQKRIASRGTVITRDTKMCVLADMYLAELEAEEKMLPQTIDNYRKEINRSDDKRADPKAIKIKTALGNLRIWEADAPRLDMHIKTIRANGHRRKAELHAQILTDMMGLAVRHGAIEHNPMREVKTVRRRRVKPKALGDEIREALQAQLEKWVAGEEIPGTPAYTYGPRRDRAILQISDIILATGTRPHEALALRRCDVIKSTDGPWRIRICGTLVRVTGEPLYRQEWPKSASGYREVLLPEFAVQTLKAMGADDWDDDDETPLFPSQRGGWRDPHNFGRTWRAARGEKFKWVTLRTLRKENVTTVFEKHGPVNASLQAGHAHTTTTERHYVDRPALAPDSTAALNKLGRRKRAESVL
ncbi:tyrosine-type recombinase/integrase [Nocardia transvalensis]|uniref:tyrosine-type recombinase/integrase n=1 Tax=Nocardia transvalensis TaxID=37333 RepID=UPI001894FF31|nr:hypothetical protein [Nocardia transvalensis]MBF6332467.1 hypothetical protein [Nocardia transvalensis]